MSHLLQHVAIEESDFPSIRALICPSLSTLGPILAVEPLELLCSYLENRIFKWATSSEFVSSSIPSWQILTAHAQPFRGVRDLAFCLKIPLDSLPVWASSKGIGETARMRSKSCCIPVMMVCFWPFPRQAHTDVTFHWAVLPGCLFSVLYVIYSSNSVILKSHVHLVIHSSASTFMQCDQDSVSTKGIGCTN